MEAMYEMREGGGADEGHVWEKREATVREKVGRGL